MSKICLLYNVSSVGGNNIERKKSTAVYFVLGRNIFQNDPCKPNHFDGTREKMKFAFDDPGLRYKACKIL